MALGTEWGSGYESFLPCIMGTRNLVHYGLTVLAQDLVQDLAMHVGQTPLDAVVIEAQSLVIETEQMENRGMQVMPRNRTLDRFPAEFIGGSECHSRFEPGSGHPAGEAVAIVVAPWSNLIGRRLGKRSAAEFGRE